MAGCSGLEDANNRNFTKAIDAYFAAPDNCARLELPKKADDAKKYPPDSYIRLGDIDPIGKVLTDRGIFVTKQIKADGFYDSTLYTLTPEGQRLRRAVPYTTAFGGEERREVLCVGHRVITHVDEFTQPAPMEGHTVAEVKYTYRVVGQPPWVDGQVSKLVPTIGPQSQSGRAMMVLTNHGWTVGAYR